MNFLYNFMFHCSIVAFIYNGNYLSASLKNMRDANKYINGNIIKIAIA